MLRPEVFSDAEFSLMPTCPKELLETIDDPRNTPVIIDLVGPQSRIEMIAERLPHSEVLPTEEPGEAQMWIVGFYGGYVVEDRSPSPMDFFYVYGFDADEKAYKVAVESTYLMDIGPLAEAA